VPRDRHSHRPTTSNPPPAPFVEGDHVVTTSTSKPADRDITSPTPPSHPLGSADLRILRAWVQAEQRQGAPACERPVPTPTEHDPTRTERCESCRSCQIHHTTIVSAVVTAIDDSQARRVTRATLTDLFDLVPPHLRPFFGLAQGEGLKRLLGRWSKTAPHAFVPADVPQRWQLTEAEAEVYWWHMRGWSEKDIQRELTPKEMRANPEHWTPAERVYELLGSAGAKVRGLFGLESDDG
jgi:hypothetical protein